MGDTMVAIEVGKLKQQMATRDKKKTSKKKSKKPSNKKKTVKKWKLERQFDTKNVLYEKLPKKGYLLIVAKNSIVRDTSENRAKYANVNYKTSTSSRNQAAAAAAAAAQAPNAAGMAVEVL